VSSVGLALSHYTRYQHGEDSQLITQKSNFHGWEAVLTTCLLSKAFQSELSHELHPDQLLYVPSR
jgi:hypothetical protein